VDLLVSCQIEINWPGVMLANPLNQSQGGIYIDTGLANTANTVIPANAGIRETVQNVRSWTLA